MVRACIPASVKKLMIKKEEEISLDPQNLWETIVGVCGYNPTSGELVADRFQRLVGHSSWSSELHLH